jgi:hypothetical protein
LNKEQFEASPMANECRAKSDHLIRAIKRCSLLMVYQRLPRYVCKKPIAHQKPAMNW